MKKFNYELFLSCSIASTMKTNADIDNNTFIALIPVPIIKTEIHIKKLKLQIHLNIFMKSSPVLEIMSFSK